MKKELLVCCINEKYIPAILALLPGPVHILGREGLDYSLFANRQEDNRVKIYKYPYPVYKWPAMFFRVFGFFDAIYLPCHDANAVPGNFIDLEKLAFLLAKQTVFIDPQGQRRALTRSKLLDQLAWHKFCRYFKL